MIQRKLYVCLPVTIPVLRSRDISRQCLRHVTSMFAELADFIEFKLSAFDGADVVYFPSEYLTDSECLAIYRQCVNSDIMYITDKEPL